MSDSPANARARHILLVDDDPAFMMMMKDFLLTHRPGAWTVHTAEGYSAALNCLKQQPVELVVLDLNMPVMDGLQFLTLLKRSYPGLHVVILTSQASAESRMYCLQNGAALFLNKLDVAGGFEKVYDALETVVSTSAEGFRGMLRQVGLSEVLQMECLGRKSSILEIGSRTFAGRIFIQDGSIIHAEAGNLQGEAALFALLGLAGGEFRLKPFWPPPRVTIDGHWESLLMEAARLRDEAADNAGVAAPETSVQAAVHSPAPSPIIEPPPVQPGKSVEEVLLCSVGGEVLYAWQSSNVERRIQLIELLAQKSVDLERILPLGMPDRVVIETGDEHLLILLHPERKVFARIELKQNQFMPDRGIHAT